MLKSTKNFPLSIALAIAIAMLFLVQPQSLMAQATTTTTNVEMPVNQTEFDCNGNPVMLSGTVHMVTHFTTDAAGGTHIIVHTNYQDVSGTSPTNPGVTYRAINNSNQSFNSKAPQMEVTTVETMLLVSQGPTDNLRIRVTTHITFNANGDATAEFARFEVVCRG